MMVEETNIRHRRKLLRRRLQRKRFLFENAPFPPMIILLAFVFLFSSVNAESDYNFNAISANPAKAILFEEEKPIMVYKVVDEVITEVTAYNVGVRAQTDETPCIGATGENLCQMVSAGERICAVNRFPIGTRLYIQNFGECVVLDRMNSRYRVRVDIAMGSHEIKRARKFGVQKLRVGILVPHDVTH